MLRTLPRGCTAALLLAAASALPREGSAQTPAHLRALTIPPDGVGTCMPAFTRRAASHPKGRRLVMKTRDPGGEREITLHVDERGRPTALADRASVTTGAGRSVGAYAFAAFEPTGTVRGRLTRLTIVLPPEVLASRDPAVLRARAGDAVKDQDAQPLDAAGQRQARALAEWLRDRCPAAA
jgi:hypothetical protein